MYFLTIDGSYGEGGGQIVRTAVSLSAITGKPIQIVNIRAKRDNPGLRPQHLSAVKAVADLFHAKAENLKVGADWIRFIPPDYSPPHSDSCLSDNDNNNISSLNNNNSSSSNNFEYGMTNMDIGTAGSIPLVLLTIIPAISLSGINHSLQIIGGTDVRYSPTIDYLRYVVREIYARIGINFSIDIIRRGYYPKGGGIVNAQIRAFESPSTQSLTALSQLSNQSHNLNSTIINNNNNNNDYDTRIREKTKKKSNTATAATTIIRTPPRKLMKIKIASICSQLPKQVAERQLSAAISNLSKNGINITDDGDDDDSSHYQYSSYNDSLLTTTSESSLSPGSSILVFSTSKSSNDNNGWYIGADSIGEKGKRAETVGLEASNRFLENYLKNVPIDYFLADISIVPFSLMKGRSRFRVAKITEHLKTNLYIASRIVDGCKYFIEDVSFSTTASVEKKHGGFSCDPSVRNGYIVNIEVGHGLKK
ncbi:MAG: RNA 3'-terminal phosphate cyclase [Nitrososphaeraceae archaeon]